MHMMGFIRRIRHASLLISCAKRSASTKLTAASSLVPVAACSTVWHLPQQMYNKWPPFQGFACSYAKGKANKSGAQKQHPEADITDEPDATLEPELDSGAIKALMQQAVDHLQHELAGVRTGRANPGLLENIIVEAHGDKLPLKACGTVTVRNPQLLAVSVFDAGLVKAVEKAIRNSPLSFNPAAEGSEVLVKLPNITKDTIDKMIKLVNIETEEALVGVRRARQKGMDTIKKTFKQASANHKKQAEKEVQKRHDQYVAEIERLRKLKDSELKNHSN
eukprot:jgi/Chrzof1/12733/Cz07g05180.t1